ncbi:DUF924 family protein [Acinetobacter sp. MB5]|uniref:DUF924 family protein n=1 Tax=Acinetobacter sp. MB5 TaxID=2069438 RepID=UPI000DD06C44|nr:DUF924 family protein [Acinetobacter sp. MB5]
MYQTVIKFWFEEIQPSQWFKSEPELDLLIRERFTDLLVQAKRAELFSWRDNAMGRLAEIILLDQFSRNIFRGHAEAFSADSLALVLAQEAIRNGCDKDLAPHMRAFCYLPYMHSESSVIHQEALKLFNQPGLEGNLEFEIKHKAIIDRFGRYPHRNQVLGRSSTAEELDFLMLPGSSF